jgi:hypothetical protein
MRKVIQQLSFTQQISILIFFIFTALLYIHNVTHDIYSGDIGDLVTAAYVHGVAHPPGYPLFTFLGYLFTKLPLVVPVVTKVAYLSVVTSFLGLILFFSFSYRATKSIFIGLLSTATLAFSHLYWIHAEIPEVFALNNLIVIAIVITGILFYQTKNIRYFYLLGFLAGLSLTHHHTIFFVLPGMLVLIAKHTKVIFSKLRYVLIGFASFAAGLLPYLYVPIAASTNPIVNWDHATTLNNFLHLVLRKDYGFAPPVTGAVPEVIKTIFAKDYIKTLVDNYSYQMTFVALLGMIQLLRKDRWLGASLIFTFIFSGPVFIFYAAPTISTAAAWGIIERMYTFSITIFAFFFPFGLLFIKEFFAKRFPKKIYGQALLFYFWIIPIFMLVYNFPKTDLSTTKIGNNLAMDIMTQVPKNALLFSDGDTTTFNMWYMHYVLGYRPDIGLINPAGVGGSNILDGIVTEYKVRNPDAKLSEVLDKALEFERTKRPVYGTFQFPYQPPNTTKVPYGLVFALVNNDQIPDKESYIASVEAGLKKYHIQRRETLSLANSNLITSEIPLIYSNALVRIGDFMTSQYKDYDLAEHYYRRGLWIDPENPAGYAGLALSQFKARKECKNAISNMKEAINIYRVWKAYHLQLYLLYDACDTDKKTVDAFKRQYRADFKSDVEKDLQSANVISPQ